MSYLIVWSLFFVALVVVKALVGDVRLEETKRHNAVMEAAGEEARQESRRHNRASERASNRSFKESARHNRTAEKETQRHNAVVEGVNVLAKAERIIGEYTTDKYYIDGRYFVLRRAAKAFVAAGEISQEEADDMLSAYRSLPRKDEATKELDSFVENKKKRS